MSAVLGVVNSVLSTQTEVDNIWPHLRKYLFPFDQHLSRSAPRTLLKMLHRQLNFFTKNIKKSSTNHHMKTGKSQGHQQRWTLANFLWMDVDRILFRQLINDINDAHCWHVLISPKKKRWWPRGHWAEWSLILDDPDNDHHW